LAQGFICRQSIRLGKRKRGKPFRGHPLTRRFRALLYHAHDIIQFEETHKKMLEAPQHRRHAQKQLDLHRVRIDAAKAAVGQEWTAALTANTCAGLSVRDLASKFGKPSLGWYRTIYSYQSDQVHHSDPTRFAWHDEHGNARHRWVDEDWMTARALWTANGAFGLAVNELSRLLNKSHPRSLQSGVFSVTHADMKAAFANSPMVT
jgi:hypothetical protein